VRSGDNGDALTHISIVIYSLFIIFDSNDRECFAKKQLDAILWLRTNLEQKGTKCITRVVDKALFARPTTVSMVSFQALPRVVLHAITSSFTQLLRNKKINFNKSA